MIYQKICKKIAFEGSICTGKTVIFNHYKAMFLNNPSVSFVNEAATEYLKGHPKADYQASVGISKEIQEITLKNEQAAYE